uniref:(California timema) hypothetical protein n=1 Tax=Timema californicum TaxID=61474 RepID=A0A7R9JB81_TIMCA|nr:unnamed protein product [Timema californicum]
MNTLDHVLDIWCVDNCAMDLHSSHIFRTRVDPASTRQCSCSISFVAGRDPRPSLLQQPQSRTRILLLGVFRGPEQLLHGRRTV